MTIALIVSVIALVLGLALISFILINKHRKQIKRFYKIEKENKAVRVEAAHEQRARDLAAIEKLREQEEHNLKRRKTNYGRIFRRILLGCLVLALVICLMVFGLDKYSYTSNHYVNKYPDKYWQVDDWATDKIEGFNYYEDIDKATQKYDITKKDVYEDPFEDSFGDREKILASRYQEELDPVLVGPNKALKNYDKQLKDILDQGYKGTIQEWIIDNLWLEESDYADETVEKSAYEVAVDFGYQGTKEDFFVLLDEADEDFLDSITDAGFVAGENDANTKKLAASLVADEEAIKKIKEYDVAEYNRIMLESQEVRDVVALGVETRKHLPDWVTYRKTTLLGFGGIATGYANKPVFTKTAENGNTLEFWFNTYLTTFKVVEKDKNDEVVQTWYSNPEVIDEGVNEEIRASQETIINLSYAVLKGETNSFNNYTYSVSDYDKGNQMDLVPQYAVKVDPETNTLTVWYHLGKRGIDYTHFPYQFSKARLDEFLARNKKMHEENPEIPDLLAPENNLLYAEWTRSIYKIILPVDPNNKYKDNPNMTDEEKTYYEIDGQHKNLSGLSLETLNKVMYDYCGYTEEDLMSDNAEFGNETKLVKAEFSIAIEYTLTEQGLTVNVPGNSIIESNDFPVTKVSILPYFTATKEGTEGYTIIPDGSGAILKHDNGNTAFPKYTKRVYTKDLADVSFINHGQRNDLMFPMYSVVNTGNNSGILAYATQNTPQLELSADISGRDDNYNKSSFTVYLREYKDIIIGSSNYAQQLVKWTQDRVKNDTVINYAFLNQNELSYSMVAHKYQGIIEDLYGITAHDMTKNPVLDMTVIGTYSFTDNFVGIPYKKYDNLTSADELQEIIDLLTGDDYGIKNINAYYLGWRSYGLKDYSFKKMKVSNLVGSKNRFEDLLKNQNEGINIYPYLSFGEINKIQESFGRVHYASHQVDGDFSVRYPYDLNSNTWNKQLDKIIVLSPRYYEAFGNSLINSYNKATRGFGNIALGNFGNNVTGDYKRGVETFRVDALFNQVNVFNSLRDNGIKNVSLSAPYDYAFKYTNAITNVPYQSTLYEIFDYSIPFYQLVLNGIVDYSGESINENSQKGINEHLMRIIETGSNISFTLSYDSSEKLLQTDYNKYFYTLYKDWLEDIKYIYDTLDELGIYGLDFESHEMLDNNVFKVVYSGGSTKVEIVLNYSRNNYIYEGITVPSKSYKKVN